MPLLKYLLVVGSVLIAGLFAFSYMLEPPTESLAPAKQRILRVASQPSTYGTKKDLAAHSSDYAPDVAMELVPPAAPANTEPRAIAALTEVEATAPGPEMQEGSHVKSARVPVPYPRPSMSDISVPRKAVRRARAEPQKDSKQERAGTVTRKGPSNTRFVERGSADTDTRYDTSRRRRYQERRLEFNPLRAFASEPRVIVLRPHGAW